MADGQVIIISGLRHEQGNKANHSRTDKYQNTEANMKGQTEPQRGERLMGKQ